MGQATVAEIERLRKRGRPARAGVNAFAERSMTCREVARAMRTADGPPFAHWQHSVCGPVGVRPPVATFDALQAVGSLSVPEKKYPSSEAVVPSARHRRPLSGIGVGAAHVDVNDTPRRTLSQAPPSPAQEQLQTRLSLKAV